jgi:hypothetical protein
MAATSRGFFTGGIGPAACLGLDRTGSGGVPVVQLASTTTEPAAIQLAAHRILTRGSPGLGFDREALREFNGRASQDAPVSWAALEDFLWLLTVFPLIFGGHVSAGVCHCWRIRIRPGAGNTAATLGQCTSKSSAD